MPTTLERVRDMLSPAAQAPALSQVVIDRVTERLNSMKGRAAEMTASADQDALPPGTVQLVVDTLAIVDPTDPSAMQALDLIDQRMLAISDRLENPPKLMGGFGLR